MKTLSVTGTVRCLIAAQLVFVVAKTHGLLVPAPPVITVQPQSREIDPGADADFEVAVSGTQPIEFQWHHNDEPIDGATEPALTIPGVAVEDTGDYYVVARNADGQATSDVARLSLVGAPSFRSHPLSTAVELGTQVQFSAIGLGVGVTYQWLFNGAVINGATARRYLIPSVQTNHLGLYTVLVSNSLGTLESRPALLSLRSTFTAITDDPVVTDIQTSWSGSWGDYDRDGWIDLFVGNGFQEGNALYRNDSGQGFVRMTTTEIGDLGDDRGDSDQGLWADMDNDGDLDLFIANWTLSTKSSDWANNPEPALDALYWNDGDGTFTKQLSGPPVDLAAYSGAASFADIDNDGFIDLYVATDSPGTGSGILNLFYRNLGGTGFERITQGLLAEDRSESNSGSWADFDDDGDQDLLLIRFGPGETNYLYVNDGLGNFNRSLSASSYPFTDRDGYNAAWADYDNDGDLDVFHPRYNLGAPLFRNDGDRFSEVTILTGSGEGYSSCAWVDVDNDGDLDLFVARNEQLGNLLLLNNNAGGFQVTDFKAFDGRRPAATAWGDYNNDGFMDLFVANGLDDGFENIGNPIEAANELWRNERNDNHWIKFDLEGSNSNASAIGAQIRVTATIWGEEVTQMRHVFAGGAGLWTQHDIRPNFGLGDAEMIDTVRIEWPSGTVQELRQVEADQILSVAEPPELGIEPAVILSWPVQAEGYVLEAAPALSGPWQSMELVPAVSGNMTTVAVPITDAMQVFRLRMP